MERLKAKAQETLQGAAETAVSYRLGQIVLRQADRAFWAVEKSARWALPPSVDHDDSAASISPGLVRPLPWPVFLMVLVWLRAVREGMSLFNLLLGKPPVRPAEIVAFIQSRRRYLRALKYQGTKRMRARAAQPPLPARVASTIKTLVERTLCYRQSVAVADNANGDEQIVVVKKKRRADRESGYESPQHDERAMERLLEKMVDMYGGDDSDDSEYTLTNATSTKSDSSSECDSRDATLTRESEMASSTPHKRRPDAPPPPDAPQDCSHIRDLLEDSNDGRSVEAVLTDLRTETQKLIETEMMETKKNAKMELSSRDSDVPMVRITPAAEDLNTNGSTEGLYQANRNSNTTDKKKEGPKTHPSSSGGKHHRAKETKIKSPNKKYHK